ncbi:MAG: hypothetical protein ABI528_08815, partial [bacterium]
DVKVVDQELRSYQKIMLHKLPFQIGVIEGKFAQEVPVFTNNYIVCYKTFSGGDLPALQHFRNFVNLIIPFETQDDNLKPVKVYNDFYRLEYLIYFFH